MKPTSSSIANLASIAFLLALSTADRHWSVPVSLIGTGVAYLGFAVWTSRKENAQKADRAFREIAKQARIIIESRKKRDIENGRAPRSEESHLNEINEPGFTYADYLKYKPE